MQVAKQNLNWRILFDLIMPSEASNYDFENSILLYDKLKLTETQATDTRLWSYLTHVKFWNYMRKRWDTKKFGEDEELSNEKEKNRSINFIVWRYHLKTTNKRRLIRNGISRLWWYAHLTVDNSRDNRFELTQALLSDLDIAQNLLERTFGSNKAVLHGIYRIFY